MRIGKRSKNNYFLFSKFENKILFFKYITYKIGEFRIIINWTDFFFLFLLVAHVQNYNITYENKLYICTDMKKILKMKTNYEFYRLDGLNNVSRMFYTGQQLFLQLNCRLFEWFHIMSIFLSRVRLFIRSKLCGTKILIQFSKIS